MSYEERLREQRAEHNQLYDQLFARQTADSARTPERPVSRAVQFGSWLGVSGGTSSGGGEEPGDGGEGTEPLTIEQIGAALFGVGGTIASWVAANGTALADAVETTSRFITQAVSQFTADVANWLNGLYTAATAYTGSIIDQVVQALFGPGTESPDYTNLLTAIAWPVTATAAGGSGGTVSIGSDTGRMFFKIPNSTSNSFHWQSNNQDIMDLRADGHLTFPATGADNMEPYAVGLKRVNQTLKVYARGRSIDLGRLVTPGVEDDPHRITKIPTTPEVSEPSISDLDADMGATAGSVRVYTWGTNTYLYIKGRQRYYRIRAGTFADDSVSITNPTGVRISTHVARNHTLLRYRERTSGVSATSFGTVGQTGGPDFYLGNIMIHVTVTIGQTNPGACRLAWQTDDSDTSQFVVADTTEEGTPGSEAGSQQTDFTYMTIVRAIFDTNDSVMYRNLDTAFGEDDGSCGLVWQDSAVNGLWVKVNGVWRRFS